MISVNHAVSVATQKLRELFGEVTSIRLEEVFQTEDESAWGITLSFLAPATEEEAAPSTLPSIGGLKRRYYKTFEIDAESGNFRSMKIRPVPSV
jgi:hypothetical protein